MTVAMKDSAILMQVTDSTHLSPLSRLLLATVVVTEAKHTAEKIDSAIHTGKRLADMSVLISISMRVAMMLLLLLLLLVRRGVKCCKRCYSIGTML